MFCPISEFEVQIPKSKKFLQFSEIAFKSKLHPLMLARKLIQPQIYLFLISLSKTNKMKRKVIENYTLCESIGEGSFGKVYLSVHNITNEKFAVKVIPMQKFQQNSRLEQCSANEVRNLTRIESSPYIIKFVEMLKTPNNFYFVYEFCNGKTLEARLKQETRLSEKESLRLFGQLLQAFKVLNKYNIMHRDLKPDNIFFHNGNLKLGDFGFCKTLSRQGDMTSTMLGSPIYMAPQVLRGEIYTAKADIWSLGVVLYEMLFGVCPFESNSIAKLIAALDNTDLKFPTHLNPISETTKHLLKRLLTKDQFKRIDWFQLLTMSFEESSTDAIMSVQSRPSSNKSLVELEKRIEDFGRTNLSNSHKSPLSLQHLGSQNQPPEPDFKKKSDSSTKYNPESQKLIYSESIPTNQSINDQPVSQPLLFSTEPLKKVELNSTNTLGISRKLSLALKPDCKRQELLAKHNNCLLAVKTAMSFIKYQDPNSTLFAYIIFQCIQSEMQKIMNGISIEESQLSDVFKTVCVQLKSIDKQILLLEKELVDTNTEISQSHSPRSSLEGKFGSQSNKRLWYQMIAFVTESRIDPKATEAEWNSTIASYLK